MIYRDQIYIEMMSYYAAKAGELDHYWNKDLYPHTRDTDELFAERHALDYLVSHFIKGAVLDLGCGTGHFMEIYLQNCSSAVLVDQSREMLYICEGKLVDNKEGVCKISFNQTDLFELDLPNGSFDCCLLSYILGHFPSEFQDKIISRVSNLLKPKGLLLVIDSMFHENLSPAEKEGCILKRQVGKKLYHIYKHYFQSGEIQAALQAKRYTVLPDSFIGTYFSGMVATNG